MLVITLTSYAQHVKPPGFTGSSVTNGLATTNYVNDAIRSISITNINSLNIDLSKLGYNTLYVSASKGNDATAAKNDPTKPYLDLELAAHKANLGDLVYVQDGIFYNGGFSDFGGGVPIVTTNINYYVNDGVFIEALYVIDGSLSGLGTFQTLCTYSHKLDEYVSCREVRRALLLLGTSNTITHIDAYKINTWTAGCMSGKAAVINAGIITNLNYNYPVIGNAVGHIEYANKFRLEINADLWVWHGDILEFPFSSVYTPPTDFIINIKKIDFSNLSGVNNSVLLADNDTLTFKNCDIIATNNSPDPHGFRGLIWSLAGNLYPVATNHITFQNCRVRLGAEPLVNEYSEYAYQYYHFVSSVFDVPFVVQGDPTNPISGIYYRQVYYATNISSQPIVDPSWYISP